MDLNHLHPHWLNRVTAMKIYISIVWESYHYTCSVMPPEDHYIGACTGTLRGTYLFSFFLINQMHFTCKEKQFRPFSNLVQIRNKKKINKWTCRLQVKIKLVYIYTGHMHLNLRIYAVQSISYTFCLLHYTMYGIKEIWRPGSKVKPGCFLWNPMNILYHHVMNLYVVH